MHVLVTGGAGFIGSHVVDALLARGDAVTVLDSLVERVHPNRQPPAHLPPQARFIRGDVTVKADWERALEGVEAIVHFAAYQDYQPDFSRFAMVNDGGTALLYEVAVERKLALRKVVVASSQALYGEGRYRCAEHADIYPAPRTLAQLERGAWDLRCPICQRIMAPAPSAEAHTAPHNAYAISKLAQEHYAFVLGARYGIPSTCLRFSIVQGPRQSPANAYSGVLRAFTSRLLQGKPPVVFEDGRQLRDYTHSDDVVAATLLALDRPETAFEAYNVGGGETITVLAYARMLAEALGVPLEPDISGRFRVGDTRHIFSDTAKLQRLGWRPAKRIADIVHAHVAALDRAAFERDWATQALVEMERTGAVRRAAG